MANVARYPLKILCHPAKQSRSATTLIAVRVSPCAMALQFPERESHTSAATNAATSSRNFMPNKNKTQKVDAPENASRYCRVVGASIVDQQGRGDGAYDLHDVKGTPEEVGAKIAASLKESSLSS